MATNQFLGVATSGGANVATQAAFAANSAILTNGFAAGIVDSATWNKILRQSSLMSAMLGQIIVDQAVANANDTDTVATLEANFLRAMRIFRRAGSYGVDTGSAANIYQFAYVPSVSSVGDGDVFMFRALHTNTGASTFTPNPGTIAAVAIWDTDHQPLSGGEILVAGDCHLQWNSTLNTTGVWLLINSTGGNTRAGRLIGVQLITATGTYTPTPGMKNALVKIIGGGAGGGGCAATGASTSGAGGGGASGAYAEGYFSSATIGASQAVTIGAGGNGGVAGANTGSSGGTTSFGAIMSAPGGVGGAGCAAQTAPFGTGGGPAGSISSGGTLVNGGSFQGEHGLSLVGILRGGAGAGSPLFGGAGGGKRVLTGAGQAATAPGAGGSGAGLSFSAAAVAGGDGADGAVLVFEYSA